MKENYMLEEQKMLLYPEGESENSIDTSDDTGGTGLGSDTGGGGDGGNNGGDGK